MLKDVSLSKLIFHQEVEHYLRHLLETWTYIMGSQGDLRFVDDEAIRQLELRVPGLSWSDQQHVKTVILNDVVFRSLTDESKRRSIAGRAMEVCHLIPSIRTLQKDFKYLRQCTDVLRQLVLGNLRPPSTVQSSASEAFRPDNTTVAEPEVLFRWRLKSLYLHIMQNLVELSGESPLLEDDEEKPRGSSYDERAWHRLAKKAQELGFVSPEITRLSSLNPGREAALQLLRSSEYEYDNSIIDGVANSINAAFERARRRSGNTQPSLTTLNSGEPIARRCGRHYTRSYAQDRWFLTWENFTCPIQASGGITSLFVRRAVFQAFWGLEDPEPTQALGEEPAPPNIAADDLDEEMGMSPSHEHSGNPDLEMLDAANKKAQRGSTYRINKRSKDHSGGPSRPLDRLVNRIQGQQEPLDRSRLEHLSQPQPSSGVVALRPPDASTSPLDPGQLNRTHRQDRIIKIFFFNEGVMKEESCSQDFIINRIMRLRQEHPHPALFLLDGERRGIQLEDCLDFDGDCVYLLPQAQDQVVDEEIM